MKTFLAMALLCWALPALAGKDAIYSHWSKGAVKGVDVVAYFDLNPGDKAVKGSKEFTYEHKGAIWRFSNQKNLDKFKANPQAFEPQYGGYCAFAVAKNFAVAPRPDNWKIVDGKLYLNNNKNSFDLWLQNQSEMIQSANGNWPAVLEK